MQLGSHKWNVHKTPGASSNAKQVKAKRKGKATVKPKRGRPAGSRNKAQEPSLREAILVLYKERDAMNQVLERLEALLHL